MKQGIPSDLMPPISAMLKRISELRDYVELSADDIQRCVEAWQLVQHFSDFLIDDFYEEILRHPDCAAVIRGGESQVSRLKISLSGWLKELFAGQYDEAYVRNRWLIGWRHVKIGLSHVWASAAMNRLRLKLFELLAENWEGSVAEYHATASAICRLMDLDLTLIEDAYHTEAVANFLRYEKEFNESIIATTQAIVLLLEADSGGRIVRGNRYLTQLINDSDDFPPHVETIFDMVPEVDRGLLAELLESQDSKSQGPVTTQLFDSNKRTRTIRWFSRNMNDSVVIIGENNPKLGSYHLIVGHDVTDVVEAQRRAVQQERLAAIGQTMAGLAHESRNAFQRSQAALENLALDVEDRPESVQLVERIQRANDHLLHLYEEVLQFAKPVRLDVHPCSLEDLVHITCQHICQATSYDAKRFSVTAAENCFPISADPYAVEQILRNLIENAIAVSQQDATVDIVVKPSWQGKDRAMRVEINDRGPGISPEYRERVFEPFFSTRPKGTGLGLPISRRLAEAHGGNLTLVGRDGGGTTAILELPEKSLRPHMLDPESQPDLRRSQSNGS